MAATSPMQKKQMASAFTFPFNTPMAMPPGVVSPASISKVLPVLAVTGGLLGCVLWVFLCMGAVSVWGCALAMAFKAARWIWN